MNSPTSGWSRLTGLRAWEVTYLALGLGALTVLLTAGSRSPWIMVELAVGLPIYFIALRSIAGRCDVAAERLRLVLNYFTTFWLYGATSRISLALGAVPRDLPLLALDELLFGKTPAVSLETLIRPWLTETLSTCYFSYHLYLLVVVLWTLQRSSAQMRRFSALLFSGFAVGFFGYFFFPALGPGPAYPGLFSRELGGGMLTHFNDTLVAMGSAIYGNFPSLHLLVTLLLLDYDWRECRRRFWIMLVPATGMFVATIYLRYHYAVDLVAALALFPLIRAACAHQR